MKPLRSIIILWRNRGDGAIQAGCGYSGDVTGQLLCKKAVLVRSSLTREYAVNGQPA
ncbi:MAG TPA: hypothetical protein VND65_07455 [Candidatus Binatia bacterium]|nr:hypothetical protein [Candidatus Binatia bacterium]